MPSGYELLSVLRLTKVIQALSDVRDLPQQLRFASRLPMVPAVDGEIMGRWINRVQIADLISDDARATTYTAGKMILETTPVPNIKHGRQLSQSNIQQLMMIGANPGLPTAGFPDNEVVGNFLLSMVDDLQLGCMQRVEALAVAMHVDAGVYNRFGFQFSGGWGMPTDLKITTSVPWTDASNGTPINDIWNLKRLATVRYGMNFDRVSMSTSSFIYMISTTEFQNKARVTVPLTINYTNFPLANTDYQRNVAQSIMGVRELELYDARFWSQDESGVLTSAPFMPINKVVFGAFENDNNPAVMDFANGVCTESTLSSLLPNMGTGVLGSFTPGQRGPIAYTTVNPALNPPNLTVWAVMRGFPRKYRQQATACLTVGQFTDVLGISEPFGA